MDDESKEQLLSLALVCAVNLAVIPVSYTHLYLIQINEWMSRYHLTV